MLIEVDDRIGAMFHNVRDNVPETDALEAFILAFLVGAEEYDASQQNPTISGYVKTIYKRAEDIADARNIRNKITKKEDRDNA